jgi:hypothetical protein
MSPYSNIRADIDRTRDSLAEKTSELADRAAQTASRLRPSQQMNERPFTMLALSVAAGFLAQRLLFGRRAHPPVVVVNESHRESRKREPLGALASAGQMAAGALAREVAARLMDRAPQRRESFAERYRDETTDAYG